MIQRRCTLPPMLWRVLPGLLAALLASCAHMGSHDEAMHGSATQLVLVTSAAWDDAGGTLRRYERSGDGAWQAIGSVVPVMLGRNGSAWGQGLRRVPADGPRKREGDGRAPAGMFAIGIAFGYDDPPGRTALPYDAMDIDDWCIDVADSPLYNRIVNARDVGTAAITGSTEPMRRDLHADGDARYKLGFVIEHNAAATPGGGSCIFAHLWRRPGEATAGCTAMAEPAMRELLAWLDPARSPVFVLLPAAEHARLAADWDLPHPAAD